MDHQIGKKLIFIGSMIIFLTIHFSCIEKQRRSDYKLLIEYLDADSLEQKDLRNDTVAFDFNYSFSNDSLKITHNGKDYIKTIISTNDVTGKAPLIVIDSFDKIKYLTLQINDGKIAKMKCDKNNQLFTVWYVNDTLKITSVRYFIPGL
jgi:hypothetical protein